MEELALSLDMDGSYDASADEFYEEIEAPKFVDLTIKDPVRVDDRYWFCSRVGCDQKHEEELDSEEIYKNFVLRVMAARSPNVRLQKVLSRRAPIATPKCPLSAPPKSSRSRMALISCSINQKFADKKAKATEAPGASEKTPVAKVNNSSVVAAKYMTTPRNKYCAPKRDLFLSVKNPKAPCLAESKSRVTKALVFHSPRKTVKLKASLELKTPVRKACERMKKVDDECQKKRILGYSPKSSSATRPKIIRPWRVNNSGQRMRNKCEEGKKNECQDIKGHKVGPLKSKKRKSKDMVEGYERIERAENHSAELNSPSEDGQVEQLIRDKNSKEPSSAVVASEEDNTLAERSSTAIPGELEVELKPQVHEDGKASDENQASELDESIELEVEVKEQVNQDGKASDESQVSELNEGIEIHGKGQLREKVLTESETEDTLKELTSVQKEPGSELPYNGSDETADKENESAPDQNICKSSGKGTNVSGRKNVGFDEQPHKKILKVTRTTKSLKECAAVAGPGAQGMKYSKPKTTNPKPFRLRTDERGILKEANLDKRVRPVTLERKHESALHIDRCSGEVKSKSVINSARETKPCRKIAKPESNLIREVHNVPELTRPKKPSTASSPLECGKDNTAQKPDSKSEKPRSILSSGKQRIATPSRANTTHKRKVYFMIPEEKIAEVWNANESEKSSKTFNSKKSPSMQRSPTLVASRLQKPRNSAWKLP